MQTINQDLTDHFDIFTDRFLTAGLTTYAIESVEYLHTATPKLETVWFGVNMRTGESIEFRPSQENILRATDKQGNEWDVPIIAVKNIFGDKFYAGGYADTFIEAVSDNRVQATFVLIFIALAMTLGMLHPLISVITLLIAVIKIILLSREWHELYISKTMWCEDLAQAQVSQS